MIIRQFGSLGDIVALTGLSRELKKNFPDEIIHIFTFGRFKEIFENNPYLEVGKVDSNFDITIPTSPNDLAGNYVRAYCDFLKIKCYDDGVDLFLTSEEKNMFPEKLNTIAIDVFAGWPTRRWKFENYVKLVDLLHNYDKNLKVIEVGATVPDCFGNFRTSKLPNVDDSYLDKLSVRETASLLSKCRLFIGSDTGLFHLSAAVKIPQIVLFTVPFYSRVYRTTYPLFSLNRCTKCDSVCSEKGSSTCLNDVIPEDVIKVLEII